MDIAAQQKDCDALAGLFQHIVTDLKVCAWLCNYVFRVYFHNYVFSHFLGSCKINRQRHFVVTRSSEPIKSSFVVIIFYMYERGPVVVVVVC